MISTDRGGKTLCMSALYVEHMVYGDSHFFTSGKGKNNSSFGYIITGSVALTDLNRPNIKIKIPQGGLFYIPEGARYNSVWTGAPDIEFYSVDIISKKFDSDNPAKSYSLQHIERYSTKETEERIIKIYNFLKGDDISKIRAVSLYYEFFADVLPYLELETPKKFNPATICAMDYIEKNSSENFSIDELARECSISQSRLYHLFREDLKTTPLTYRNEVRIQKAMEQLREGDDTIESISANVGFKSTVCFRQVFKSVTGFNPSVYRKSSK